MESLYEPLETWHKVVVPSHRAGESSSSDCPMPVALATGLMSHPSPGQFEPLELWRNASEPIFWLDSELRLAWVNPAWEDLTGHRSGSVVGLTSRAHAPSRGDDLADLAASFHPPPESLAGQPSGTKALIFHSGGERLSRRVEFWPFRDQNETLIGLLGVVRGPDDPKGSRHPCEPAARRAP